MKRATFSPNTLSGETIITNYVFDVTAKIIENTRTHTVHSIEE